AGLSVARGDGPLAVSRLRAVALNDVELSTHGRRLRISGDLRPHGDRALTIGRLTIDGDDMHATVSGEIDDLSPWKGRMRVDGDALDGDVLRSLAWDLLEQPRSDPSGRPSPPATGDTPLALELDIRRLTLGPVAATAVRGTAAVGPGAVIVDPVAFG